VDIVVEQGARLELENLSPSCQGQQFTEQKKCSVPVVSVWRKLTLTARSKTGRNYCLSFYFARQLYATFLVSKTKRGSISGERGDVDSAHTAADGAANT